MKFLQRFPNVKETFSDIGDLVVGLSFKNLFNKNWWSLQFEEILLVKFYNLMIWLNVWYIVKYIVVLWHFLLSY